MQGNSKIIDGITDFLFTGKKETELSFYEIVILLGNDDIELNVNTLLKLYETKHFDENSKIILSGNVGSLNSDKSPESHRMYEMLKSKGYPMKNVIIEDKATNSYENFKFSLPLIEKDRYINDYQKFLCIGKAFLGRRAMMSAKSCGYPIEKMDYYGIVDTENKNIGPDSWWKSEPAKKRVFEEIERIGKYAAKGDLSI